MTSDKSYTSEQRLNGLVPRVGTVEGYTSWMNASPPVFDHWADTGGMANGWGKGSGFFKYVHILPRLVLFHADGLTTGTVSDGTTILSAANGFPTGYVPPVALTFPAWTDNLKTSTSYEGAQFTVNIDGSVTCRGFATSATVACCWGLFPSFWY